MTVNCHGGGTPLKPYNVWLDDFMMEAIE